MASADPRKPAWRIGPLFGPNNASTYFSLRLNAAAVIFTNNHPSGVPEPSRADENLRKVLKDALALVDVRVLDHVVACGASISFA